MPLLRRSTLLLAVAAATTLGCTDGPTAPVESGACRTTVGRVGIGDTVTGVLTRESCRLSDDTYADRWRLSLPSSAIITIDLMSDDFDSYLIVRDEAGTDLVFDDDGGDYPKDARITHGFAAGNYIIVANVYDALVTGAYTLTVQ